MNKNNTLQKQKEKFLNIRIVLDRSGSMSGSEKATINALNTYLNDLKRDNIKGFITLSTFDSVSIDIPINSVKIEDLEAFNIDLLEPRGSTPLFDAIGLAIYSLQNIDTFSDDKKVLVIVTDGRENSSKEYNYQNISEMIKEKEESGWLIIYLGADHDVFKQARSLNFNKKRIMKYSKKDSVDTFKAVSRTTRDYSRGTGNKSISFTEDERRKSDKQIMSVYADGLMRKAHRQMKENYKQTGFYETNAERVKRESKLMEEE